MAEIIELTAPGQDEQLTATQQALALPDDLGPVPGAEPDLLELTPAVEVTDANIGTGLGRAAQRFGEPALTLLTAAGSEGVAGLAGIIDPINPFTEKQITPEAGATRTVEAVREAGTFIPRSELGKKSLEDVAESAPIKAFIEALQFSESLLGEFGFQTFGPAGGALFATIPTAVLEALGLKALRNLRLGRSKLVDANGRPTPDLEAALKKAGIEFDDLTPAAKKELTGPSAGKIAEEAARRARFKEQGLPFTQGDVTQNFKQASQEQRLLSMTLSEEAGDLQVLKAKQSEKFIKKTDELVESLDAPVESGIVLKEALEGRAKLLKKEKGQLYEEFAKSAPETLDIPIITDSILDALPDAQKTRRLARSKPTDVKAVEDLLIEFGIDTDAAKVQAFLDAGEIITPLNIGNLDDFRQGLNLIERTDQTGTISNMTGPLKRALDSEADLVDAAARAAGVTDESVLAPLKKARATVRQLKTEFSPQAIAGRLTKTKPDGVTPIIEASKAVDQVIGKGKPVEFLERTMESLNKAGPEGQKAIKGLQAAVILQALEKSLSAASRKFEGVRQISGNAFSVTLEQFGDKRLALLFKNNPAALKKLKALQQTGFDISPPAGAVVKGTGANFLDFVSQFPIITEMTRGLRRVVEKGADQRAVKRALSEDRTAKDTVKFFKTALPEISLILGIGGVDVPLAKAQQPTTEQEGEEFFDQGTARQRKVRRGITPEQEQNLADKLGFGVDSPDERNRFEIFLDEIGF